MNAIIWVYAISTILLIKWYFIPRSKKLKVSKKRATIVLVTAPIMVLTVMAVKVKRFLNF